MLTTSHFDYGLAEMHTLDLTVEDFTGQPLDLMRGENSTQRNNFNVGDQSSIRTMHARRAH